MGMFGANRRSEFDQFKARNAAPVVMAGAANMLGNDAPSPQFGGGSVGNPPGVLSMSQWSIPVDGSPMPVEGVRLADAKPKKGGFFAKDGAWRDVLGAIGDGLAMNAGRQPIYLNWKLQQQANAREDEKLQQQRQWQIEDRDWKLNQPDYFMSGRDRVRFNPLTGQSEVVYDGTEDFDQYAATLGLQPGTDEYFTAVQDYVLRGNGPSALGYDKQLDDYRTTNDKRLDDYRTSNRVKVRGVPTWRDRNPRPVRSAAPKRPRATNGQGQAVEWNGKEWVAAK
jgi:hypothetical protein